VYPALTVLQALIEMLKAEAIPLDSLWVGSSGGMEADLVQRLGIPFETIPAAGVHGVGWRALPGNLLRLAKGFWASRRIIQEFNPDVMLFTGGYLAAPMALAGKIFLRKPVPSVLFVPDIEPGLALKTLARFAEKIAVTAEDSQAYFKHKGRVVVTGYPVRRDLIAWDRQTAFQVLNLTSELPVLLVVGGSSGAQSINRALISNLVDLLPVMQIIHVSGQRNWAEAQVAVEGIDPGLAQRYHLFPYLHAEMGAALRAADLVLSRAGASCLGEYPAFGLPAILAPYPHAWRYQQINAEYLAKRDAAIILPDEALPQRLLPAVLELIHDPNRLVQMHAAMLALATSPADISIAGLIRNCGSPKRSGS
jgi:UDP-N-acetylglucosamine--N-acetylmuramyl-(pentapeptide) pyrophosphoryl-undecaprenol N-acetylglucosamine transferase